MNYDFDVIVIGAGSGGLTAAIGLAKVGKKVLLVERDKMGGECTNSGCIPSKSLIHHAREYGTAKESAGETDKLKAYKDKIFDLVRKKISDIRSEESPSVIEKHHGVKVVLGEASFTDSHRVRIQKKMDHETHSAKFIVIATGSSPRRFEIPGLDDKKLLTNENLFELKEAPKKILIIGGGPIGCEMAQALTHLGSKVTIANKASHLVPREEHEISDKVQKIFEEQGMKIINSATISRCERNFAIIEQEKGMKKKTITQYKISFDFLLLSIGRVPNMASLNIDSAGIKCTDKGISVDRHYRTNKKHIFAIGDVSSVAKFTHSAEDQARHVVKKILLKLVPAENKKPLPRVTYMNEEVASVGMTYAQACRKYDHNQLMKITVPYGASDRSKTDEAGSGVGIVTAKRLSGKILGASLMGKNAGELISVFTLAIQNGISLFKLNKMIVPYPVLGQLYKKISDQFLAITFKDLKNDLKYLFTKHSLKLLAVLFWGIALFLFYRYKTVNDLSSLDLVRQLFEFVTGTTYGPFAYILVYAIRPIIFFPATLLTLISGALFGFWWGILYTIVGENMSANLAYGIGRYLGKDFCKPGTDGGMLSSWQNDLRENSFISVLVMRFIYIPFDLTNYGCGLLCIHWPAYFFATFIGILPGLITFVSFGATIENIESFELSSISFNPMQLLVSIVLFLSSLVFAKLVLRKHKQAKLAPAQM